MDPDDQKANPSLSSGVDAYTVVPRPGKVIAVNFPLFETSQIEGTVSTPPGKSRSASSSNSSTPTARSSAGPRPPSMVTTCSPTSCLAATKFASPAAV